MEEDGTIGADDELRNTFRYFRDEINRLSKFPYTDYRMREELRVYPQITEPRHTRGGTEWAFSCRAVKAFLVSRQWWVVDT
jgi:hypothetical protein